jgi:hypothetical protein
MTESPLALVTQRLGLPAGADEATILSALDKALSDREASKRVAANQRDHQRIVHAAIRDGRIAASRAQVWLNALNEDPEGATRVITSLAAVPPELTGQPAVDLELERVSAIINGAPYEPSPSPQAAVQAAAAQPAPPLRGTDQPVTTTEELNAQIESDAALHRAAWAIGGAGGGLKRPPEQLTSYPDPGPSYNPKPQLVVNDDGTAGQWVTPKADWQTPGFGGTPPATGN